MCNQYNFVVTKGRSIDTIKATRRGEIVKAHDWYFNHGWNVSEVVDRHSVVIRVAREQGGH